MSKHAHDWGRSVRDNAYFGIKGKSESGRSTVFATHEYKLQEEWIIRSDVCEQG